MLNYLQTPGTRRRNLEDRLARIRSGGPPRSDSRETSGGSRSRTRSRRKPDRTEERKARRAAERIMEAGRRGSRRRGLDVGPEAERAARFILEAAEKEPDEDVDEAVDLIKRAGKPKDTQEDEAAEEE